MARSVTAQEIIDRAERRADMVGSGFLSEAQKLDMVDEAYTVLYDQLVEAYQDYFHSTDTISISPGTTSYSLPSDFYKLIGVDFQLGSGQYITIMPFTNTERNGTLTSSNSIPSGTVRLRYVPAPQVIDNVADTIDGISGWERLLVLEVAIMMLECEESDTAALENRKALYYRQIETAKQNRDIGLPGRVSDVYAADYYTVRDTLRYHIYGNNIEFQSAEYVGNVL